MPTEEQMQADLEGHYCKERCETCGCQMLLNRLGDKWCSGLKCLTIKDSFKDLVREVSFDSRIRTPFSIQPTDEKRIIKVDPA